MNERINDLSPMERIEHFMDQREHWSDEMLLTELRELPSSADEHAYMDVERDWDDIYLFVALAYLCAQRRLRPAVMLLLDRASAGDPGEMMRGLRHSLEAIVDHDWEFLADVCVKALNSKRPGTRRWALDELGVLRLGRTLEAVRRMTDDPDADVCETAWSTIERIEIRH